MAVKIRNQCNCVIGYRLGESNHPAANGEANVLKLLAPLCATFVDIGANVGNWSDAFISENGAAQGWLYEPSAQCATRLNARFANRNVSVRNVAHSNFIGQVAFAEEPEFGEGSSIAKTHLTHSPIIKRVVEVATLDSEFSTSSTEVDFVKIDTEG
jgi:FkbM family methyltransferase